MKKTITAAIFLFALTASAAFGQTTADEWYTKAGEYFESGDYAGAITAYSETIRRDSSNLNAYWFRAWAYYKIKNYDTAIADSTTVIKGAPDFPGAYIVRGDAYGAKGAYHTAAADYKTGLEKGFDPGFYDVDKSSKASMWFCGAMFMEITVNRFLGKPDVVAKYENWLKTVCDKSGLTRAEVEAFYRQNIGALIAQTVDENLNKTFIPSKNYYDMEVIYYPETGGFRLTYTRDQNGVPKEITAKDLPELGKKMTSSREFSAEDIAKTVNDRALKIPSYVYSEWVKKGISQYNGVDLIKEAIARFYAEPTQANYNVLVGISARYWKNGAIVYQTFESNADEIFSYILHTLSPELDNRIDHTIANSNRAELARLASVLEGSRYGILLTPYVTGGFGN